jgi:hypothetical protein
LIAGGATCLSGGKRENNWGKKKITIISAYEHTKLKLTVFMLLGGPQNTIKSHLVFTALFCFAPFSVFSSRMSAPHWFSISQKPIDRWFFKRTVLVFEA